MPRLKHIVFFTICLLTAASGYAQPGNGENLSEAAEGVFEIGSIESIIIEREGEIIHQDFRGRMNPNRATNIKSASKSILSLLIGIAIEEGYIESVNEPIGQYFREYFEENPDSVKEAITIRDLLTMRAGLESTSIRNYGRWVVSSNWVEYALSRDMVAEAGGRMVYSTGTSHLLSVILTRASGMSTRAFANHYLFEPMGMELGGWDRDPQGYYMGGNNMAMRPADMLKIGRMMMNLGEYNGRQIVPADWILESVEVYTRSNFNPYDFGYMWWRRPVNGYEIVFAWGHGGQYIMMLPEIDTVIVMTSNLMTSRGRGYQRELFRYLETELLPALAYSPQRR